MLVLSLRWVHFVLAQAICVSCALIKYYIEKKTYRNACTRGVIITELLYLSSLLSMQQMPSSHQIILSSPSVAVITLLLILNHPCYVGHLFFLLLTHCYCCTTSCKYSFVFRLPACSGASSVSTLMSYPPTHLTSCAVKQ